MWGIVEKSRRDGLVWIFTAVLSLALAGCSGTIEPFEQELEAASADVTSEVQESPGGAEGAVGDAPENDGGTASGAPALVLSASELLVPEGDNVTLSWTTTGADSCNASGGWSGQLSNTGTRSIGPVVEGTTFSLTCSGAGGSALEMISISVVGPVELSWIAPDQNADGSELVDLAGYRVYFGESSRDYGKVVELTDTSATSHTLDLPTGSYYFAMTAFDTEGHESSYSNEVQRHRP